jgi:hypothetical protein
MNLDFYFFCVAFTVGFIIVASVLWLRVFRRTKVVGYRFPAGTCPVEGCRIKVTHSHTEALIRRLREDAEYAKRSK